MSKLSPTLPSIDNIDLAQHAEILEGAIAEGVDLGSRLPQIRALSVSLRSSLEILRHNGSELEASPDAQVPIVASVLVDWRLLIQKLQKVIELADRYDPSHVEISSH